MLIGLFVNLTFLPALLTALGVAIDRKLDDTVNSQKMHKEYPITLEEHLKQGGHTAHAPKELLRSPSSADDNDSRPGDSRPGSLVNLNHGALEAPTMAGLCH